MGELFHLSICACTIFTSVVIIVVHVIGAKYLARGMVRPSMCENNDEKKRGEMNWPDGDLRFQQQKIEFRRLRLSFLRSVFLLFSSVSSPQQIRKRSNT